MRFDLYLSSSGGPLRIICGLTKYVEHTKNNINNFNCLLAGVGRMKIHYRLYVTQPYHEGQNIPDMLSG